MSFEPGPECRTPRTCRAGQSCEEVARLMHATMQGAMGSWAALACGFSPEKMEEPATPQAGELASAPPINYGELISQCEMQLLAMAAEVDRLQALMETARRERVVVAWLVREIDTEHPLLSFEASAVAASITQASWAADGFESEIVELFEW